MDFEENLQSEDKAVFDAIECELKRQQNQIELIASENIVSNAVNTLVQNTIILTILILL